MSEMTPETGGNMLTRKYGGIPGWVFMAGAAVLVYVLFLRNKSGSNANAPSSSGGGGTSTTGDITFTPGSTTVQFQGGQSSNVNPPNPLNNPNPVGVTNPSPVSQPQTDGGTVALPSASGVPNPQPSPVPMPRTATHHIPVDIPRTHPAHTSPPRALSNSVTVAKWTPRNTPWNSTLSGIAHQYHTTVANLLKLNPNIHNANVIYPGQHVRVH